MKRKLIFVHGLFGSQSEWDNLTTFENLQPICLTLPGHGANPVKKRIYSVSELARSIYDQVSSFGECHFVGYSLGGRVCLELFKKHPGIFKSLTLVSSSPGLKTDEERELRLSQDRIWHRDLNTLSPKAFFIKWYAQGLFGPIKEKHFFNKLINKRILDFNGELSRVLIDSSPALNDSMWPILKTIPYGLFIAGETDTKYVALGQSVLAVASNFKLEIVRNAGHALHLERPEAFVNILREFFSQQTGEK